MIELNDFTSIGFLIAICATASWGLVQTVKMLLDGYFKSKNKEEPWWRNGMLRALSVLLGGSAGIVFPMESIWIGMLIGIASGCLNTIIVAKVKVFLKNKNFAG